MRAAMEHRAVIEQAKGILIGSLGCDPDAAFGLLVQQSQHENRKLREIAALIAVASSPCPASASGEALSRSTTAYPSSASSSSDEVGSRLTRR